MELDEACLAAGMRDIVFSSSCMLYGTPADVPVTETAAGNAGRSESER